MFDIVIKNGWIVDGSGAPMVRSDLGLKDGIVSCIGKVPADAAKQVVEANGLVVAPGFIDIHSHDDLYVLEDESTDAKVRQGVTTTVIGNCGFGLFPVTAPHRQLFYEYASSLFGEPSTEAFGFDSLDHFFGVLQARGSVLNVAALTAHGLLRIAAMGFEQRKPADAEMTQMKSLLRQNIKAGSVGISLGMIYPPGSYADTEELVELSKVVSDEGGILTCHMRNEANLLIESIEEMLQITKAARIPLEISHLKTIGAANAGKAIRAVQLLSAARSEGVDVTYDQYPYPAGSTTITTLLPPWALEGGIQCMIERIRDPNIRAKIKRDIDEGIPGSSWETMWRLIGWDQIMICSVQAAANKQYEGKFIQDIVKETGQEAIDYVLDLILDERGNVIVSLQDKWHTNQLAYL